MSKWVLGAAFAALLAVLAAAGFFSYRIFRPALPDFGATEVLKEFRFDAPESLGAWSEKLFRGKTRYQIAPGPGGEPSLRIVSEGTSSAMYREIRIPISDNPVLEWDWHLSRFPGNKKNCELGCQPDNDFPLRIYVIFKARSIFSADIIEYVWDESQPVGAHASSPFSDRVKLYVVHTGKAEEGAGWSTQRRSVVEDYRALFGKEPSKDVAAIAFMGDSDDTQSSSEAFLKRISVNVAPDSPEKGDTP